MRSSCSLSSSSNPSLRSSPKSDPNSSKSCYNLRSRVRWRWEKFVFCLRQDHVGRHGSPRAFLVSENHTLGFFLSLRERHFKSPRGALSSSGAEIPAGAQFLLREPAGKPKVVILAQSSSPTRGQVHGCCTSSSPIPPRHLRWLTHQLQLD